MQVHHHGPGPLRGDGELHQAEQRDRDLRGDLPLHPSPQDYFSVVDEATDCEEPRAKTVNLYRCLVPYEETKGGVEERST